MDTYIITRNRYWLYFSLIFIEVFVGLVICIVIELLGISPRLQDTSVFFYIIFFFGISVFIIIYGQLTEKQYSCPYEIKVVNDCLVIRYKILLWMKSMTVPIHDIYLIIYHHWYLGHSISIRLKSNKKALLYMPDFLWKKEILDCFAKDMISNHNMEFIFDNGKEKKINHF